MNHMKHMFYYLKYRTFVLKSQEADVIILYGKKLAKKERPAVNLLDEGHSFSNLDGGLV
jgi:hypothetical protein